MYFSSLNQSTDIAAHYIRWLKSLGRDGRKSQVHIKYQKKDQNTYSFPTWQGSRGGRQQSDDQVRRSDCLYIIYLSRVARVEKKCCALKTDPVAFPAAFSRQLDLVFLPQQPLLDREEARLPHRPGAVEGGPGAALLGLILSSLIQGVSETLRLKN